MCISLEHDNAHVRCIVVYLPAVQVKETAFSPGRLFMLLKHCLDFAVQRKTATSIRQSFQPPPPAPSGTAAAVIVVPQK